jgi:DnaJ-class molecular chaperone
MSTIGFTKYEETANCPQCDGDKHIEGGDMCPTCLGTGSQKVPYEVAYNGSYPDASSVLTKSENNTNTGANAFHDTDSDSDGVPDEVV